MRMRVLFASYGNDSIALIEWAKRNALRDVTIAYSETGWAAPFWQERVIQAEAWAASIGYATTRIPSRGMVDLIFSRKAWPRGGGGRFQFCTHELKEAPALEWLARIDPDGEAVCMVGIRREESANRATFPEWVESSERHGGRSLHAPLACYTSKMRDELLSATPFAPLPHRSRECYPCVNARKKELRYLDSTTAEKIDVLEKSMGVNSNGNARVMFSPKRHGGAVGIKAVIEEAKHGMDDLLTYTCDGGYCE